MNGKFLQIGFILSILLLSINPLNAQWERVTAFPGDQPVAALASSDANLFGSSMFYGPYISTDYGLSWSPIDSGLTAYPEVLTFAAIDTNIFVGLWDQLEQWLGVFRSTNNGTYWTKVNNGLTDTEITVLEVSERNLFAGTNNGSVFLSTNNGTNWIQLANEVTNAAVNSIAVSGTYIFIGAAEYNGIGGVFRSTNYGTNWTKASNGLTDSLVNSLVLLDANLLAGTQSGIYRSTNYGTYWSKVSNGLTDTGIYAFAVSGTSIFAGGEGGIFLSTNYGTSWTSVNDGQNLYILCFDILDKYLFAGGGPYSALWRRPLSEMITDVKNTNNNSPTNFSLMQNYPNPFNPGTKIKYSVSQLSNVQIKIFDVLGNEIEILINEEKPAGIYELTWDAGNLPSGIYFYQLRAGDFVKTKKMILLK